MSRFHAATGQLEERFVAWAQARPDVRAAIVVGSWARIDHPADEWSDLDIGFTTTDPQRYLSSTDWLGDIAPTWVTYPDPSGVVHHVLFEGGLDAGIAVLASGKVKQALRFLPVLRRFPVLFRLLPRGLAQQIRQDVASAGDYYRRGARVILDKDGLAARFLALFPAESASHGPPTQSEFLEAVNEFWFLAVWTAKHVRRGELWFAKTEGCDGQMKSLLLRMLEWRAQAEHGWDYDTWEKGRFLEEWADPTALRALEKAFARYEDGDIRRALMATMDLFRWLAADMAERLGYPYPPAADERVTEWTAACLSEGMSTGGPGGGWPRTRTNSGADP
jgi:aminoglycoside 6-adenylyltransferase